MKVFGYILRKVCEVCAAMSSCIVFLLMIWGTVGVGSRAAFNYSMPGQYEGSSLLLVLIVYLAVANTQFEDGHVKMSFVVAQLKGRRRRFLEILGLLVCLVVSAVILWRTGIEAIISFQRNEFDMGILALPIWPGKIVVAIAFLLLLLTLVYQIWCRLCSEVGTKENNSL